MKLGVRAHDFGKCEPEKLAETIATAGFETVQLALPKAIAGINTFSDVTPSVLERVRRAFSDNRLEIGVLGCYSEIGHTDRDTRLKEVDKFLLGLEHAKELGVRLAGTETTRFSPAPEMEHLREAAYRSLVDSVLRMVEKAEKLDIDVGVETVADHTLHSAELTRRLLDEVKSPRLRVIFDPVNLISSNMDIQNQNTIFSGFLETIGKDVVALHVKDIVIENGEKVWRNIGQGEIRYEPIFKWLNANNPDIPVLREHVKPESCQADLDVMKCFNIIND